MCIALPAEVLWVGRSVDGSRPGAVQLDGGERAVDFSMLPDARPGDHVVVHAGFAIRIVAADVVRDTAQMLGWGVNGAGGGA